MFGYIMSSLIFYVLPFAGIVFFVVSLCRYNSAKKANKSSFGAVPEEEMKKLKTAFIVSSVIAGVLVVVAVGIVALILMSVAFM